MKKKERESFEIRWRKLTIEERMISIEFMCKPEKSFSSFHSYTSSHPYASTTTSGINFHDNNNSECQS